LKDETLLPGKGWKKLDFGVQNHDLANGEILEHKL